MADENKVKINVSPDRVEARYSDFAVIGKNALGVNLDFGQRVPGAKQVNVISRIAMSPQHAKIFAQLLAKNIADYEREFGEIKIPKSPRPATTAEDDKTIHFVQ